MSARQSWNPSQSFYMVQVRKLTLIFALQIIPPKPLWSRTSEYFQQMHLDLSVPLSLEDKVVRSSMFKVLGYCRRDLKQMRFPIRPAGSPTHVNLSTPRNPPKNQNFSTHIPSPHLPQSQSQCPRSNSLNPSSMVSKTKLSSSLVLQLLKFTDCRRCQRNRQSDGGIFSFEGRKSRFWRFERY
jgi:hypothetical protein